MSKNTAEKILGKFEAKAKIITDTEPVVVIIGVFLALVVLSAAARWPGLAILAVGILLAHTFEYVVRNAVVPELRQIADRADRHIEALERQAAAMEKMAAEGDSGPQITAAEKLEILSRDR